MKASVHVLFWSIIQSGWVWQLLSFTTKKWVRDMHLSSSQFEIFFWYLIWQLPNLIILQASFGWHRCKSGSGCEWKRIFYLIRIYFARLHKFLTLLLVNLWLVPDPNGKRKHSEKVLLGCHQLLFTSAPWASRKRRGGEEWKVHVVCFLVNYLFNPSMAFFHLN